MIVLVLKIIQTSIFLAVRRQIGPKNKKNIICLKKTTVKEQLFFSHWKGNTFPFPYTTIVFLSSISDPYFSGTLVLSVHTGLFKIIDYIALF